MDASDGITRQEPRKPPTIVVLLVTAVHTLWKLRQAYEIAEAPGNVSIHYYPKFRNQADRHDGEPSQEGLDEAEWLQHANVDAPHHYFKGYLAVPWLTDQFQLPDPGEVIRPLRPKPLPSQSSDMKTDRRKHAQSPDGMHSADFI